MSPQSSQILLVPDVAQRLRIEESTLRWWRHVGKGPRSFKIGRRIAYYLSDIEAYEARQYETTRSA